MNQSWATSDAGIIELPSGRLIRGRSLANALPSGTAPDYGLYLGVQPPQAVEWNFRFLRWRDFWLPADREDAVICFEEALERSATDRVEVACRGGKGRTGTALACIAILDGVKPDDAMAYVRKHYLRKAVETPWQKHYVRHVSTH